MAAADEKFSWSYSSPKFFASALTLTRFPTAFANPPARHNYKQADWERFAEALHEFPVPPRKYLRRHCDADRLAITLQEWLTFALDECTRPLRIVERSKRWWTTEVDNAYRTAKAARRRARQAPTESNMAAKSLANRAFNKTMHESQAKCWEGYLAQLSGNDIWSVLRYLNPRPRQSVIPPLWVDDIRRTQTLEDKVGHLRDTLLPPLAQPPAVEEPIGPRDHRWPLLARREVDDALDRQDTRKAAGPDGIKTAAIRKAWKACQAFADHVLYLFSYCIRTGYHPLPYRNAHVVVLPKAKKTRADLERAKAYRPISLLNTMGKLLEKIVHARLTYLVDQRLPVDQYGGRHGYSAPDALTMLVDDIEIGEANVTSVLAIDIKGAFDNVRRDKLLEAMRELDVPTAARNWTMHFTSERTASLLVDGKLSPPDPVSVGVPQGSPISPLLFLIHTHSLYERIKARGGQVLGYIDDITIYVQSPFVRQNAAQLESILEDCHEWAGEHGIEIDYGDKLGLIHCSPQKHMTPADIKTPIRLPTGELRTASADLRLLGLQLDTKLTFNAHLDQVIHKTNLATNVVSRVGGVVKGMSAAAMKRLYCACARSIMEYGQHIWYPRVSKNNKVKVKKLQTIQNKGLRRVLGAYMRSPVLALHRDAEIPMVDHRMQLLTHQAILRVHRGLNPANPLRSKAHPGAPASTTLFSTMLATFRWTDQARTDVYWPHKPPWAAASEDSDAVSRWRQGTFESKERIKLAAHRRWDHEFRKRIAAMKNGPPRYSTHTYPGIYRPPRFRSPLRGLMKKLPRSMYSRLTQMRTNKGAFGEFFQACNITTRRHDCLCGHAIEDVAHILQDCPLYEAHRSVLRRVSPELSLRKLLDTRKGLRAVAELLTQNPSLLSTSWATGNQTEMQPES